MSPVARRPGAPKAGRKKRINPLIIAAIVIALSVFVVFYAFNQGLPFVGKYTLYAVVDNSVNVRSDSPVRIAGIDVGGVIGTSPDGERTRIEFAMNDNGLPIHTDATVTIRDRLFLEGGYYLQLNPGTPSAPLAHPGFTIEPQNTATPVQFYKLLSTFDASTRSSLESTLNTLNEGFSAGPGLSLARSGAGGLKAAIPQLTPTLVDVSRVSRALRGTQAGDLGRLLTSAADLTGTLDRDAGHLVGLIDGLDRTSSALAAADGALAQSVTGVDQTLQVAPPALSAIDRSLPPLTRLARALTPSLRVAPPLVTGISRAVSQLTDVVKPSARGPLLSALRTTFTTFPSVLTQLGGVFPVTRRVTDCLNRNVIPVLNTAVQDGGLSSGQPVWKDFVHFLPSVAGATGSFDGDGHYTRVLLGAGENSLAGGLLSTVTGALASATKLVGITPGGKPIEGVSPHWIGTLTPSAFRPDVGCATQAVPALTAAPTASDLRSVSTPAPAVSRAIIGAALSRAEGKGRR